MTPDSTTTWSRRIEIAALVTVTLIVLSALVLGLTRRHFDVDEIQHLHVTWLVSVGERPFHDFVESHPPFAWYLASPLMRRLPDAAAAATTFRWLAGLGGLAFVAALLACVRAGFPEIRMRWPVAGVLLVLSRRANLDYLLEIRPDSIAYATFFFACFLFLSRRPAGVRARYAVFAFLSTVAALSNPKLVLLTALFVLLDLGLRIRSRSAVVPAIAGHLLGGTAAVVTARAVLYFAGIDPLLAYELSIGFHRRFFAATSFSGGLLRRVLEQPLPLAAIVAGVVVWSILVLRRRRLPTRLEVSLLVVLIAMLLTIPLPYKQYFAPWFLMAAPFVAFVGSGLERLGARLASIALVALLAVAAVGGWQTAVVYGRSDEVRHYRRIWKVMERVAEADGRVVAAPRLHPVFRKDVFYAWFKSFDPRGRDQAAIMREWNPRGYGERFTRAGYVADLARNPPALIVKSGDGFGLRGVQESVVAEYVTLHREDYLQLSLPGVPDLLVRRDRANREAIEELHSARGSGPRR